MKKLTLALIFILIFAVAAYADYRESFKKEFLMSPWAGTESRVNACIECHTSASMIEDLKGIPSEWRRSWHFQNDVDCQACHGGDVEDATMSMSHNRGFTGSPKDKEVPQFCGKCHIGILETYTSSGHGKVFMATGEGPNCVTCHGSHAIQKASISIINEQLCTQCHSYERAKLMRQALFLVENKISDIEEKLAQLKGEGVMIDYEEKNFFSTQAEFRTLFHAIDVELVKQRTDEFSGRMNTIDARLADIFRELSFRENFAAFIFLLLLGLFVVVSMISRTYDD